MGLVANKDGSVLAWYNGACIYGEHLSRGLVMRWATENGADLGCTCCNCHSQAHKHDPMLDDI
jgi:hypothetical protein